MKTKWSLIRDFMPIVNELAELATIAEATSTHKAGEWKTENLEKVQDCVDRHIYQARHGAYIDEQFKKPAYIHAIFRLIQEYYINQKATRNLMERIR